MEFWCRRGTLISCASYFLGVTPRSEPSRHWPIFKPGFAGLYHLLSWPGPRGGGTKLLFLRKNILCFGPSFHIWISLIVHFCDLPSVCMERQELIVLLISFPVNSAAAGRLLKQNTFLIFLPPPKNINFRTLFLQLLSRRFFCPTLIWNLLLELSSLLYFCPTTTLIWNLSY